MRIESLPRIVRFAIVGCAGLLVDIGALYFAMYVFGLGRYLGRAFSYLCAATSTWYLNRQITFADRRGSNLAAEWLRFVTLNGFGGLINYSVYVLYMKNYGGFIISPAVGVALGSLSGLLVNYVLSRELVFRRSPDANNIK